MSAPKWQTRACLRQNGPMGQIANEVCDSIGRARCAPVLCCVPVNESTGPHFSEIMGLAPNGAQERTRTFTAVKPLAPEASASTNSATWARAG
jgi:hypothetical protein